MFPVFPLLFLRNFKIWLGRVEILLDLCTRCPRISNPGVVFRTIRTKMVLLSYRITVQYVSYSLIAIFKQFHILDGSYGNIVKSLDEPEEIVISILISRTLVAKYITYCSILFTFGYQSSCNCNTSFFLPWCVSYIVGSIRRRSWSGNCKEQSPHRDAASIHSFNFLPFLFSNLYPFPNT